MFVRSRRLALCALVLLAVTASSLTFAAPSQAILSGQAPRTIGLEVIVGLTDDVSHRIAHGAVEEIEAGRELRAGSRSDALLEGFGVRIVPVDVGAAADWLVLAHWFYGDEPWSAVQILCPDRSGVFPGEDGYDDSASPANAPARVIAALHGRHLPIPEHACAHLRVNSRRRRVVRRPTG